LFSTVALYPTRERLREKNEFWERSHILSDNLCFVLFCFVLVPCLGVKIQIWRHHFLSTLHIKDVGWEAIGLICLTKDRNVWGATVNMLVNTYKGQGIS
jgi:hypothetical protein